MNIKSYVPNALTLLNLFSGLIALILVFNKEYPLAFLAVCIGIVFDFFDGFAARMLQVQSKLGVELDSMADMVTSGVVPGTVMFFLLMESLGIQLSDYANISSSNISQLWVPLVGFIITLASGYRLAKFNIDDRQTSLFIGLPTPANCLMITGLVFLVQEDLGLISDLLTNTWFLLLITLISSYLLNANFYLFSLKIKSLSLKENGLVFGYLLTSVVLIIIFKLLIFSFLIIFYVLLSIVAQNKIKK